MNCVCDIPNGGLCKRHQCVKTAHWVKLCQTKPAYFMLWEQGRGPGQKQLTVPAEAVQPKLPGGPGTELKRLLTIFHIGEQSGCKCNQRAVVMDEEGPDWCERNIETIVDWLQEESKRRKLPFLRPAGKVLVKLAIRNARRKQKLLRAQR